MTLTTRRRFVAGTVGTGLLLAGASTPTAAQARTFELEMTTDGWVGQSPSAIAGKTNPTLELEAGNEYTIEWTNTTDVRHNLVIMDEDRNAITRSDYLLKGETQTVTFTAEPDHSKYLCEDHMGESGTLKVSGGEPANTETATETATETDGGDGGKETTAADSTPGFGVASALTAIGAAAWYRLSE